MRLLLDTHTFLWATTDDPRLSTFARDMIEDADQEVLLSAASAFEIAIKAARGRLTLPEDPGAYIKTRVATFRLVPLAITVEHAIEAGALPPIHADPWDRLLVAQARLESIPLLTADSVLRRYDVETLW